MAKICGIYKIQSTCKPERIYVGSSVDIGRRWKQHLGNIPRPNGHHPKLRDHVRKYGLNDLEFSVIEQFEFISREHLLDREQYYLDTLLPWFNTCPIAKSRLGVGASDETRDKIRKANLNKKVSDKTRTKMSEAQKAIKNKPPTAWGRGPWNKGKRGVQDYSYRNKERGELCVHE